MIGRDHLEAVAQLERLRDRGYVYSYLAFPHYNDQHHHFYVRANLYGKIGVTSFAEAWGVTLIEAVDKMVADLPPDVRDAMMGVILLPNPVEFLNGTRENTERGDSK